MSEEGSEYTHVNGITHALAQHEDVLAELRAQLYNAHDALEEAQDNFDNGCYNGPDDDDGEVENSNAGVVAARSEVLRLEKLIVDTRSTKRSLIYALEEAKEAGRWR